MKKWNERSKKEKILIGIGAATVAILATVIAVKLCKKSEVITKVIEPDLMSEEAKKAAKERILSSLGDVRKRLKVYDFGPSNIHEIWDGFK